MKVLLLGVVCTSAKHRHKHRPTTSTKDMEKECIRLENFSNDVLQETEQRNEILRTACINGHTSLVRHLVTKYSCDLNARNNDGDTPFTCVGFGGSVECLELLINEFHCDINTKSAIGRTILHHACSNGHTSLVRHLVTTFAITQIHCLVILFMEQMWRTHSLRWLIL